MRYPRLITLLVLLCGLAPQPDVQAQDGSFAIGKLKYEGGGDWYANPTSLENLFRYIRQNTRATPELREAVVEPGSPEIFQFPMLYMTGHGNVVFSSQEAENLRKYVEAGGFWVIDDNYGMQKYIRRELAKVFPENELIEVPFSHAVYKQHFAFENGIPKIHEHDGKPAQAFGIFIDGRLGVFLTYETDLGDGWEDSSVHSNPPAVREKALQMGTNLVLYAITE